MLVLGTGRSRGFDLNRLGLMMCILTMYGATVAYCALTLSSYSSHVSNVANNIISGGSNTAAPGVPSTQLPASPEEPPVVVFGIASDPATGPEELQMCTGTAALVINVCPRRHSLSHSHRYTARRSS